MSVRYLASGRFITAGTIPCLFCERCTVLHYTVLHYTELHYTVLHYIELYFIELDCTELHCTELHCTVLRCTVIELLCVHWVQCNSRLFCASPRAFVGHEVACLMED